MNQTRSWQNGTPMRDLSIFPKSLAIFAIFSSALAFACAVDDSTMPETDGELNADESFAAGHLSDHGSRLGDPCSSGQCGTPIACEQGPIGYAGSEDGNDVSFNSLVLAQTFTTCTPILLKYVTLPLSNGDIDGAEFHVSIRETEEGVPTGTIIAESNARDSSVLDNYAPVTLMFDTPIPLSGLTTYALVIETQEAVVLWKIGGAGYVGGAGYRLSGGAPSELGYDFNFQLTACGEGFVDGCEGETGGETGTGGPWTG